MYYYVNKMKKIIPVILLVLSLAGCYNSGEPRERILKIYNWADYIGEAVLPLDGTLEAEIFRDKDLKRCAVCGGVFVPKSNRAKYCPGCAARVHRRQKTESERKRRSAVDS